MTAAWLKATPRGLELSLWVQPRASRTRVVGEHDGRLKVQLAAPPVDGEANEALLAFVAKSLKLKRVNVVLIEGETSRAKRLLLVGHHDGLHVMQRMC